MHGFDIFSASLRSMWCFSLCSWLERKWHCRSYVWQLLYALFTDLFNWWRFLLKGQEKYPKTSRARWHWGLIPCKTDIVVIRLGSPQRFYWIFHFAIAATRTDILFTVCEWVKWPSSKELFRPYICIYRCASVINWFARMFPWPSLWPVSGKHNRLGKT